MFDETNKYRNTGHFFFSPTDSLNEVCNAPADKSGVYLVYALRNGKIELIYIGRSGQIGKDGKMFVRKAGSGGIKDRLVNGHQFGKTPRKRSWPVQMLIENIEALDVYWYITHDETCNDCPKEVEGILLHRHYSLFGRLPRWNKQ